MEVVPPLGDRCSVIILLLLLQCLHFCFHDCSIAPALPASRTAPWQWGCAILVLSGCTWSRDHGILRRKLHTYSEIKFSKIELIFYSWFVYIYRAMKYKFMNLLFLNYLHPAIWGLQTPKNASYLQNTWILFWNFSNKISLTLNTMQNLLSLLVFLKLTGLHFMIWILMAKTQLSGDIWSSDHLEAPAICRRSIWRPICLMASR